MIEPRPYKLYNKIQHYDWGSRNEEAFIPKLLGEEILKDVPYAELWIGAHPKAPSEIELKGSRYTLSEIIDKYPQEILGKQSIEKFGKHFPFLLKVLSAAKALSIQLHPDKKQAELLHKKDPVNYPDDNHKPEIAVAVDELTAVAGFLPPAELKKNLIDYPEVGEFIGDEHVYSMAKDSAGSDAVPNMKVIFENVMKRSGDAVALKKLIDSLVARINANDNSTDAETQFLLQFKIYGYDIGLLAFFLFNLVKLKKGQGLFMGPGMPHAYISGNIIECMANSDNVVRSGLTNKFKDVETLLAIADYNCAVPDILNIEQAIGEVKYKTGAKEFELICLSKKTGEVRLFANNEKPAVILITSGAIEIEWELHGEFNRQLFKKGESVLCPAFLSEFKIKAVEDSEYYFCTSC